MKQGLVASRDEMGAPAAHNAHCTNVEMSQDCPSQDCPLAKFWMDTWTILRRTILRHLRYYTCGVHCTTHILYRTHIPHKIRICWKGRLFTL